MKNLSNNMQGILWMMVMTIVGATATATVRLLIESGAHIFQIVALSTLLTLPYCIAFIVKQKIGFRNNHMKTYSLRAVLEFCGWSLSFYALSLIPLPTHMALGYMTALFLYTVAVIVLREKANIHRWIAFFTGIAGVMIVIHPGIDHTEAAQSDALYLAAFLMFIACSCFCTCGVIIKRITAHEPPMRITFYMGLLTGLIATPTAIIYWQPLSSQQWMMAVCLGLFAFGQQFAVTKAFSKADISVVIPISLTTLLYSSLYAYFLFDEMIDLWTICGGLIVFGSVLYAIYHARRGEVGAYE
jgi:drug/metabolite transporter (DMT)-like permease